MVALAEVGEHGGESVAVLRNLEGFADGAVTFVDGVLKQGVLKGSFVNENSAVLGKVNYL